MRKLLIIDMQKGFINKNNRFLVKKIENLADSGKFDSVFATKFENFQASPFTNWLKWPRMTKEKEQTLVSEIEKLADVVICKNSYTVPDDKLNEWFHEDDEVFLCGTDYDACVLATAFQLFDHNIRPFILMEYVGSHSDCPIAKDAFEKICIKNFGAESIKYKLD